MPNDMVSSPKPSETPSGKNAMGLLVSGAVLFLVGLVLIFMTPAGATLMVVGGFIIGLGYDQRRKLKKP